MSIPLFGGAEKVLAFVPMSGYVQVHKLPLDFDEESTHALASDILNTESATFEEVGDDGVMRVGVYHMEQDGTYEHNTVVTDGLMTGFDMLTYMEGDVVLILSPTFMEVVD